MQAYRGFEGYIGVYRGYRWGGIFRLYRDDNIGIMWGYLGVYRNV